MAPEQAKGKVVDKRADIWAFGVVLFEMLTGKRAFSGDDVSDLLVAVLSKDVDMAALPAGTPRSIAALIQSCLQRDPKNRLRDIGDARIALSAGRVDEVAATTQAAAPAAPLWRRVLPWAVAGVGIAVGALGAAGLLVRPQADSPLVSHLAIPLPTEAPLFVRSYPSRSVAVSADGSTIAYVTRDSAPDTRLRVRRLDAPEFQSIPGSERARSPFFSPDGAWLAFFDLAESALKKASVRGGPAVTLQRGLGSAGWSLGSWCDDGRIVIDTWNDGLRVMSSDGGDMRVLTQPDDVWHLDPQPLPGGCRVLYYAQRADGHAIEVISADGGTPTRILDNASHGHYLASGHLLFVRDDALHIVPFDADRLQITGAAVPVPIEAVPDWFGVSAPTPQLAVSRNGTLVYAPRATVRGQESMLVAVSPDGATEELAPATFRYPALMLSPNGEQLAISGRDAGNARLDLIDLRRKTTSTVVDLGKVDYPAGAVWAPDGRALYYTRYGPFSGEIMRHVVGSRGPDEVVLRLPGTWHCAWSISPDGRWLVISKYDKESKSDLFRVDLAAAAGTAGVTPLAASSASDEDGAAISPDGKWVSYVADSGRGWELFIDRFPDGGQRTRLAEQTEGVPVWSADGRELYFRAAGTGSDVLDVMAVRVVTTPALQAGQPRRLFGARYLRNRALGRSMILAPDGRRLLMVRTPAHPSLSNNTGYALQLNVVQNWFEELRTKVLK
jgi:serine/threonine-protein kinase